MWNSQIKQRQALTLLGGGCAGHLGNGVADLVADRLVGFLRETLEEVGLHGLASRLLCNVPKGDLVCVWVLGGDSFEGDSAGQHSSEGAELLTSFRLILN